MISSNERIRIRRQMQRRIQDVVAERRRARQLQTIEPAEAEARTELDAPVLTNG
ncbi:hypothetical protein GA0074692_6163 [Micromonospora pallida]|uniref:Uncharacterized protein n=1 Tax=Micromonospora pallida TaxID=145854 RepID=A0A1C6TH88_9ACTN|nr:hypothetical protein [Micromonospora pallida]SCL41140.1 hypothetical protein GA0074692_6163 [Micromonospora pallida]